MKQPLSETQEVEARQLADAIAQEASAELLQLARTLVATDASSLFGATEFKLRDILLRVGVKAYQQHLAQKKTAMKGPV